MLARQKAQREADPEKWRAIARKRYADNREKVRAYQKAYREAHLDHLKRLSLESYYRCKEKNPDSLRAKWREQKKRVYARLTPDQKAKRIQSKSRWIAAHPDKAKSYQRRDYLFLKAKTNADPVAMEALRRRRKLARKKVQDDPVKRQKHLERRRLHEKPQVMTVERRLYLKAWTKHRRSTDPDFRIAAAVRCRIRGAIRGYAKADRTAVLIGCSWKDFISRIESLWKDGMSWSNYGIGTGQWTVDHIKPCAAFDLSNPIEQQICFHYSNLQPLWHVDNRRKGSLWNGVRYRYVKKETVA